jgi:hypothetical protein
MSSQPPDFGNISHSWLGSAISFCSTVAATFLTLLLTTDAFPPSSIYHHHPPSCHALAVTTLLQRTRQTTNRVVFATAFCSGSIRMLASLCHHLSYAPPASSKQRGDVFASVHIRSTVHRVASHSSTYTSPPPTRLC